jgi:hypothetical protein
MENLAEGFSLRRLVRATDGYAKKGGLHVDQAAFGRSAGCCILRSVEKQQRQDRQLHRDIDPDHPFQRDEFGLDLAEAAFHWGKPDIIVTRNHGRHGN